MSFQMRTAVAAVAICSGAAAFADGHLMEVSFGTNWVAQAEHGGYYQSVADGTYEACGLKVTIVPGGPQVNNRALMIAGKIDFYMGGNMLLPWNARLEGIPLKVVAAHFQKEPQILMTHPGKVSEFSELAGLEKQIIGDGGFASWYQWLVTDYGFSDARRIPYTFSSAPFVADENSAQQGYVTSEPFAIENAAGWTPDIWLLADFGFSTPATTVETMETTISNRPEVVRCFVEASSVGWANYLYGDPSPANTMIQADNPDMSDEQLAYSVEKLKEFGIVDSGVALEKGIGAINSEAISSFYDKMVAAGVIEAGIDIAASYTTEFSDTGAAPVAVTAAQTPAAPDPAGDADSSSRIAILSMTDVDKVFGEDIVALKGMNLEVREGDFVSLLGPSGCGKSTVLRLIADLIHSTRGAIRWHVNKVPGALSVVFQEPSLMPWATVEDNVWLPLRLQGKSKSAVRHDIDNALELVDLSNFRAAYPRELSGGMKMRVSIARALVTHPTLILMDEPFAALDEITRFKLNNDLLTLKEKTGSTVVFVTHSVFESVFLSDRIAIMAARPGRVIRELHVDEPYPRNDIFRTSAEYAAYCRATSDSLKTAMEAA